MTWRTWAIFIALCVIWGLPYFLIKVALEEFSPVMIAWLRIALATAILAPIAYHRRMLRPAFACIGPVSAFAFAELVIPFSMVAIAEQWISSSLTGILIATTPMTVVIIGPLFGVREKLGWRRLAGLAIGFCGVVAILGFDPEGGPLQWAGVACALVAVVGYGIGPLIVQQRMSHIDESGALAASLIVATIVLAPFALLQAPTHLPSALALSAVAMLGMLCTALALLLFFHLINKAGAARAAVVAYVNPAVATIIGVSVLDEPFGVASALGLAMILLGSWLATHRHREPSSESPAALAAD